LAVLGALAALAAYLGTQCNSDILLIYMANISHAVCLAASEGGSDGKHKLYEVSSNWLITVSGNY
jgi:hypothetical protein